MLSELAPMQRQFRIFLDDIQIAVSRIAEYIMGYDLEHFKQDYKTVDALILTGVTPAQKGFAPS